jgi:hypothetical protein
MSTLAKALLLTGGLMLGCDTSYVIAHRAQTDAGSAEPSCTSGDCIPCRRGQPCEVPLDPLKHVQVEIRGSTAIVRFAPVVGAVDYRIYPMPPPGSFHAGAGGQVVDDATYRCAGARTVADRVDEYGSVFDYSLVGDDDGYSRSEKESELGYVFLDPGPGRVPVYRLADPNGNGGYHNADWIPPLYAEANSADYVTDPARRDLLLKQGFRDDGIAFYAPAEAARSVYRIAYDPDAYQGSRTSFFFTDGPEHAARTAADQVNVLELGRRFSILGAPRENAVLLHRVTYRTGSTFDVLAAGPAGYARALHQGGPVTSLTWSGLKEPTVLVIEALDAGCPFPGAHVGAFAADAQPFPTRPIETLRAQSPTGEVFVNGQFDPMNRPQPIARSFVRVSPRTEEPMDFRGQLGDPADFADMTVYEHPYARVYRNDEWSIETTNCTKSLSYGSVLGELFLGLSDCELSLVPRTFRPRIAAGNFLHVRVGTNLPSTARRFPQVLITSALPVEADAVASVDQIPIHRRAGSFFASEQPGQESSIVVQTYYSYHEAQIHFCDHRGFGPTVPCPRASLYGYDAGDPPSQSVSEPWLPVPVISDLVGFDRPVRLDLYASTGRVYLFAEGQPVGCANLPPGGMREGEVTVAFGAVVNQSGDDEIILNEPGRMFERAYSQTHSDRRLDEFAMSVGVPSPTWDESRLPCASRWYGGSLAQ